MSEIVEQYAGRPERHLLVKIRELEATIAEQGAEIERLRGGIKSFKTFINGPDIECPSELMLAINQRLQSLHTEPSNGQI